MSAAATSSRDGTAISAITTTWIAAIAEACLRQEVDTWPKPGLVSHVDTGSHDDMTATTFYDSATAIAPFLGALFEAGANGAALPQLQRIGREAECAMFGATRGVNTHKGAIFGLGLLCAAAGARSAGRTSSLSTLGQVVKVRWGRDLLTAARPTHTHGALVARRYGCTGAREEAAFGFPSLYRHALPVLGDPSFAATDPESVRVQACFSLIANTQDTNLIHRGGLAGLRFAQRAARGFLQAGGITHSQWRQRAAAIHASFVARHLSAGGCADLLAMSLFVQQVEAKASMP